MGPIEVLRVVSAGAASPAAGAPAGRPWTLHQVDSFDRAAELLRERFLHVVVVDEALVRAFIEKLYRFYQYPFPRERVLAVLPERARRPAWGLDAPRVGALLEPPWEESLQGSLVHLGVDLSKARPTAESIATGCPLLGIRKRAWALLDALDVREGRAVVPTAREGLVLPPSWSLLGVSLRPELSDTLAHSPTRASGFPR